VSIEPFIRVKQVSRKFRLGIVRHIWAAFGFMVQWKLCTSAFTHVTLQFSERATI
jgi:hypothetical protein